jgi:hypothetical protein
MIEKTSDDLRTTYSMAVVKQLVAERNVEVFIYLFFFPHVF